MKLIAYAIALAGLLVASVQAGPVSLHRPFSTVYDLYIGGIRIGELTLDARVSGDRYRAASAMRTAGVVGVVFAASYVAETEGAIGPGGLVPQRFAADTQAGSETQAVDVRYAGGGPAEVRAEPPFEPKPWEIEPRDQRGTLDPISAALSALAPAPPETICNRTVDIFDGRRRYAIDLRAPVADGERIRCPAVYRRVAGYKPKELRESFDLDFWFEERSDGLAHLVRAASDTGFGLAVLLLRD